MKVEEEIMIEQERNHNRRGRNEEDNDRRNKRIWTEGEGKPRRIRVGKE